MLFANLYALFCAALLLSLSLMAFGNPQSIMDLVHVELDNTDALSSIRGVYGGVGFTIVLSLLYLINNNTLWALLFLTIFWLSYVFARVMTIYEDGALGSFGNNWLKIEAVMSLIAFGLYLRLRKMDRRIITAASI